jgi:ATP-binding protein involved in chromosome partitioning
MPLTAAVMVTTPQDLALHDVRRACDMFQKLSIPILGVIENMSIYQCAHCGHESHLFGQGGGEKLAQEFNLSLLAQLPLDSHIRVQTDAGQPSVAAEPHSEIAHLFIEIAKQVAGRITLLPKDYSTKFPKVVVK